MQTVAAGGRHGARLEPHPRVFNPAAIALANNTATVLSFDSERSDSDSIHSTSSNTSRLTCQTVGMVEFASNATGTRRLANEWAEANGGAVRPGADDDL